MTDVADMNGSPLAAESTPAAKICLGCRLPEDNCICGTL